jgi:hypothetical protein
MSLGICRFLTPRNVVLFWTITFIVIVLGLIPQVFTKVAWIGRRTLPIHVRVLDPSTGSPITGARVTAFEGPSASLDLSIHSPILPPTEKLES